MTTQLWAWTIFACSDLFVVAKAVWLVNDIALALIYIVVTGVSIWLAVEAFKDRKQWDEEH